MWRKLSLLSVAGLIMLGGGASVSSHGAQRASSLVTVEQVALHGTGLGFNRPSSSRHLAAPHVSPSVTPSVNVAQQQEVQVNDHFGSPVAVSIPMIGVENASVESVGITYGSACGSDAPSGCILPTGVGLVWNSTTTLPGKPGFAVLAEHDYADGAETPFWNLYKVPVGYLIQLKVAHAGQISTLTLRVVSSSPELKTQVENDPQVQDTAHTAISEVIFITCNPQYGMCPDSTGQHACDNQKVVTEVIAAQ